MCLSAPQIRDMFSLPQREVPLAVSLAAVRSERPPLPPGRDALRQAIAEVRAASAIYEEASKPADSLRSVSFASSSVATRCARRSPRCERHRRFTKRRVQPADSLRSLIPIFDDPIAKRLESSTV